MFAEKHKKFGKEKYTNNSQIKSEYKEQKLKNDNTIDDKWLINQFNNCRYNEFSIILFYNFTFIDNLNEENIKDIKLLNELIIKLSKEVNEKNYKDIIIFFQKNNYDVNNKLIE